MPGAGSQVVSLPIAGGLDEGTDPKKVTTLIDAVNVRYSKTGLVTRRFGTELGPDVTSTSVGDSTNTVQAPLVEINDLRLGLNKIYSYSKTLNQYRYRDKLPDCQLETFDVGLEAVSLYDGDVAYLNPLSVMYGSVGTTLGLAAFVVKAVSNYASTPTYEIQYKLFDYTTNQVIQSGSIATAGTAPLFAPRVFSLSYSSTGTSSRFYVVWYKGGSSASLQLSCLVGDLTWSSVIDPCPTYLPAVTSGHAPYDVFTFQDSFADRLVFAYKKKTTGLVVVSQGYAAATTNKYTEDNSVQFTPAGGALQDVDLKGAFAVWNRDATYVGVAISAIYHTSSDAVVHELWKVHKTTWVATNQIASSAGSATGTAGYALNISAVTDANGKYRIVESYSLDGVYRTMAWAQSSTDTGTQWNNDSFVTRLYPISKLLEYNGSLLQLVTAQHSVTGTVYMVDWGTRSPGAAVNLTARQVGTLFPGQVPLNGSYRYPGSLGAINAIPMSTAETAYGLAKYGAFSHRKRSIEGDLLSSKATGYVVTITAGAPPDAAVLPDGTLLVATGLPYAWDGSTAYELGFAYEPEQPTLTEQNIGQIPTGAMTPSSIYSYKLTFEWVDATGRVVYSSPCVNKEITLSGAGVAVKVETKILAITAKSKFAAAAVTTFPKVGVYRTTASGTIYYKVYSTTYTDETAQIAPTFYDDVSDFVLATSSQLYTTGDVLEYRTPPASTAVTYWKNRVVLAAHDRNLWISRQLIPGESPAFNELLTVGLPEKCTGLAVLDSNLVAFTQTGIYIVTGDGPSDNGFGDSFSNPIKVPSDDGCVDRDSIVSTPYGLMYRGQRGIMLLDRGLSVSFIGEPVQDTVNACYKITSAVLVPLQHQVRFSLLNSDGLTGDILCMDYLHKGWSRYQITDPTANALRSARCAYLSSTGEYRFSTPAGQLHYELSGTTSVWRDGQTRGGATTTGKFIATSITTAWIKLAPTLQGYQRIWKTLVLGKQDAYQPFTINIYTDYDDSTNTAYTFGSGDASSFTDTVFQARVTVVKQKSEALKVKFTSTELSAGQNVKGIELSDIALEYKPMQVSYKGNLAAGKNK